MSHPHNGDQRRSSGLRSRRGLAVTAVGLAVSIPLTAAPAMAAMTPVAVPHTIEVFPNIDMAGATGFSQDVVMEVWRGDVKVGTSGAPRPADLLELNHTAPDCWSGSTPDIIPGDQIRVVNADTLDSADPVGEYMTVANIDAEPAKLVALDADGLPNDVVMTGTASNLEGTAALELTHLSAEIVQPAWRDNGWRSRALGAVPGVPVPNATTPFPDNGDGALFYDPVSATNPLGNHWTAVWKNMPEVHGKLALTGEHSISYFERDDGLEGSGLTIMDAEDISGPAAGCPAAASDAVTGTTPTAANIAFVNGTAAMRVNGAAFNAAAVRVTLDDNDGDLTDAVTVPGNLTNPASTDETAAKVAPVRQTWSAQFPNALFDDLADGDLTVSAEFDRVIERSVERDVLDEAGQPVLDEAGAVVKETVYTHDTTTMPGRDHVLVKDTVAPLPPADAFPVSDDLSTTAVNEGRYTTAQSITITPMDEMNDVVRFRAGGATVADPTAGSAILPVGFAVTSTTTIKARSFDPVGNPSTTAVHNYTIAPKVTPAPPTGVSAVPDDRAASVAWTPPTNNGGGEISDYRVQVFQGTSTTPLRTVVVDTPQPTLNPGELSASITGLTNNQPYRFRVAAFNGTPGLLAYSALSNTVTPVAGIQYEIPGVPTGVTGVRGDRQATVSWTVPDDDGGTPITEYRVQVRTGTTVVRTISGISGTANSTVVTGLTNGTAYNFRVRAVNAEGVGSLSTASAAVTPQGAVVNAAPTVTARTPGVNATAVLRGGNLSATFNEAVTGVNTSSFALRLASQPTSAPIAAVVTNPAGNRWVLNPNAALLANRQYTVTLTGGNNAIRDLLGAPLSTVSWSFTTGA